MEPLRDVREIARVAYGFMASKVLFAALHLDVFSRVADGPKDADALARKMGIAPCRLRALLTACVSLGLLVKDGDRYANAPASR